MTIRSDAEEAYDRVVGSLYDAAADPSGWGPARRALTDLFGASDIGLHVRDAPGGGLTPIFAAHAPDSARAYLQYYHRIDPFLADASAAWRFVQRGEAPRTKIGPEVVPERDFVRTEFYTDFCRPLERRHMLGGMLGRVTPAPVAVYRAPGATPFGDGEQRTLERLLPHLQRALDLRERLGTAARAAGIGLAALDGVPAAVAVVDVAMRPALLNAAAEVAVMSGRGLRLARSVGTLAAALEAVHPADDDALRRLVAGVAAGVGSGGALRLRVAENALGTGGLVLLVSPLPARLAGYDPGSAAPGLALIAIRDTAPATAPAEGLLAELFGLSGAEAGVAVALLGGTTLEAVARARGVGLETVRSQSRAVLRKSGAANLREFEQMAAALGRG